MTAEVTTSTQRGIYQGCGNGTGGTFCPGRKETANLRHELRIAAGDGLVQDNLTRDVPVNEAASNEVAEHSRS